MVLLRLQLTHGQQVHSQRIQRELGSVLLTVSTGVKTGEYSTTGSTMLMTKDPEDFVSSPCCCLQCVHIYKLGPFTCGAGLRRMNQKRRNIGVMHGLTLASVQQ